MLNRHSTPQQIALRAKIVLLVIDASVGKTRTEMDYLTHVQQTIATDLGAVKWHLIMGCLNTHQSAYASSICGYERGFRHRFRD